VGKGPGDFCLGKSRKKGFGRVLRILGGIGKRGKRIDRGGIAVEEKNHNGNARGCFFSEKNLGPKKGVSSKREGNAGKRKRKRRYFRKKSG